jgi:hypothetical protein
MPTPRADAGLDPAHPVLHNAVDSYRFQGEQAAAVSESDLVPFERRST